MPYLTPRILSRLPVRLLLAVGLAGACAQAAEVNVWPLWVGHQDEQSGEVTAAQAIGPLLHELRSADGAVTQIWRPIFLRQSNGDRTTTHLFYPFFSWRHDVDSSSFTFFQIINQSRTTAADDPAVERFDLWPVYFSRQTNNPATSYRALLPVVGTIKHRFGKDELIWLAFPLYFRVEQAGKRTHYTPWPLVRRIEGNGHHGFELWPLAGSRGRADDYREQFALWPLLYRQEKNLSAAVPDQRLGVLPFYTRETGPGYRSENFLWPFFGYTDRTEPKPYHETRYLWPLLVQGNGAGHHVNRWAPFYSHSVIKGYDKTWLMWPLLRNAHWQEGDITHQRSQLLLFLYWSSEQRSLAHPAAAPAYKKHLWPLLSVWDNGAGRRQWQTLSPLEVFFPTNDTVRQLYTPLFALFRYDQRAPGEMRWSFLWSAVSHRRTPTEREFHLGPLFSTSTNPGGSRVALGAGLLSWRRTAAGQPWKFSPFDFRRSSVKNGSTALSP